MVRFFAYQSTNRTKIKTHENAFFVYEKFDSMLKDLEKEYRTTLINFEKYKLVLFAMAKLMEMKTTEQNKVALYFFHNIMKITNGFVSRIHYVEDDE